MDIANQAKAIFCEQYPTVGKKQGVVMSKAQRFVSEPPATPFAPVWDFTIARKETEY